MKPLTPKEKNIIAKNIRLYRERLFPGKEGGKRLAELVEASPYMLSRWEKGTSVPTPDKLFLLASAFGISVQPLCGRPRPRAVAIAKGVPRERHGRIMAMDLLILLLRQVRHVLAGREDAAELARGLRTIKRLLEKEL